MTVWEGLNPPYATIVADPPWSYENGWGTFIKGNHGSDRPGRRSIPYSTLTLEEVRGLSVGDLVGSNAHLYLWTTNRYIEASYDVARAWGFQPSQMLVWCKAPMGIGPGGAFTSSTEFVLFGRRGSLKPLRRMDTSWWLWKRTVGHSVKPPAFLDLVERVSPGPYLELFGRSTRLGWDSWGFGYEAVS